MYKNLTSSRDGSFLWHQIQHHKIMNRIINAFADSTVVLLNIVTLSVQFPINLDKVKVTFASWQKN